MNYTYCTDAVASSGCVDRRIAIDLAARRERSPRDMQYAYAYYGMLINLGNARRGSDELRQLHCSH
eukprot:SAG31_NODE_1748_length_7363_cov_288.231553_6_plen_66_part_00